MKRFEYEMDYKYDWIVFGYNNEENNLNNIFKEDNKDDCKENENKNSSENNVQNDNLNNSQVIKSNVNDLLKPDIFLNKTINEKFLNNLFKKYK